MGLAAPYYPIIYIRGYAATMGEMEETVATPFMGFNLGSTKLRQDFENKLKRFIFESPLIRLMKDEGYVDAYRDGDYLTHEDQAPAKSVWVYRYYEQSTKSLGDGKKLEIEAYARGLGEFIDLVRDRVCKGDPEQEAKFKVHLVAHSMGGLVARSYLQKIRRGHHQVDKLFTYGTPHNGIEMLGINVPTWLGGFHMNNFNRSRMKEYLAIQDPANTPANSLDGAIPPERCFCFVGTNYRDYEAFYGLSKKGTGPLSDGLVMIQNATLQGAPRAYAHRSHSGNFGIVNSEEGYQNLRRFLFGQLRVDVQLYFDQLPLPRRVQERKEDGAEIRANYDIDCTASVRGGNVVLNERRLSQASAVRVSYDRIIKDKSPAYLFSGYLHAGAKNKETSSDTALAFGVHMAINVPVFEVNRRFWFDDHFEGAQLLNETLTFHVRHRAGKITVRYGLHSQSGAGNANHIAKLTAPDANGTCIAEIPLGFRPGTAPNKIPRPGFRGRLVLKVSAWE